MAYNPQNPNGQATSANSSPVVIASDQSAIPVTGSITAIVSGPISVTQSGSWLLSANSGVDIGDVTVNNGVGSNAVNIQDGGNSITVDGIVAATQSGTWSVRLQDGLGNNITSTTRGTEQALTVQIVDGSGNQITSFGGGGGGTQYADGTTIATPTGTAALGFDGTNVQVLSTNASGHLNIADGGNSITVDGVFWQATQPVSGTVTVTQATAANLNATVTGTVAATQSGTWDINNISGTVSLPTGAATSANQTTLGSQTTKINDGTNTAAVKAASTAAVAADPALVVAVSPNNSVAVTGTFWQATQPVSGTVTANAGTGSFTVAQATAANLNATVVGTGTFAVQAAQSGTWSARLQDGSGNAITSATRGSERALTVQIVDASGTQITSFGGGGGGTQYADGTARGTATGTLMMVDDGTLIQSAAGTSAGLLKVDISGTAANATAIKVDGSAVTQPISGTVTANAGTGSFTVAQATAANLNATVTGTITANAGTNLNTSALALETGGNLATVKTNTDNLALAQASATSGQKGNLIFGAVTTNAPAYTTAQSNPLSLTTNGLLRVDGSAAIQPVRFGENSANGSLSSATSSVVLGLSTATNTVNVYISTTGWVAQVYGQISSDNTNWTTITGNNYVYRVNDGTFLSGGLITSYTPTGSGTPSAVYSINVAGASYFRLIVSSYTSGTITYSFISSVGVGLTASSATGGGGGTQYVDGTAVASPTGTVMLVDDGANVRSAVGTTAGVLKVDLSATTANATAIKVDGSAVTQPVSLATVPSHPVTNAGTFAVQADTELPAAAALADGASNPTTPTVGTASLVFNGTTFDRLRSIDALSGTAANNTTPGIIAVGVGPGFAHRYNPTALATAVNSASTIDVEGANTTTWAIGSTTTGTFIFEGTSDGTNWLNVEVFDAFSDVWVSGQNITPTAGRVYHVSAGGYRQIRIRVVALLGATVTHTVTVSNAQQLLAGIDTGAAPHNFGYTIFHRDAAYTTTQTSTIIVPLSTGKKTAITDISISVGGTTSGIIGIYEGAGAISLVTNTVVYRGEFAPSTSSKPGVVKQFNVPYVTTGTGIDIRITTSAAMTVNVQINGYYL